MTDKTINEILDYYEDYLEEWILLGDEEDISERRRHILTMIPKIREFLEEDRREKAFRWLGFIQGALWSWGDFEVIDLKSHNRGLIRS